jgi:hypothetical protein
MMQLMHSLGIGNKNDFMDFIGFFVFINNLFGEEIEKFLPDSYHFFRDILDDDCVIGQI